MLYPLLKINYNNLDINDLTYKYNSIKKNNIFDFSLNILLKNLNKNLNKDSVKSSSLLKFDIDIENNFFNTYIKIIKNDYNEEIKEYNILSQFIVFLRNFYNIFNLKIDIQKSKKFKNLSISELYEILYKSIHHLKKYYPNFYYNLKLILKLKLNKNIDDSKDIFDLFQLENKKSHKRFKL